MDQEHSEEELDLFDQVLPQRPEPTLHLKKEYWPTGELRSEGSYLGTQKHGTTITYHPTGELESETEYLEGVPAGAWKAYSTEGTLLFEANFDNGFLNGDYTQYYPDGRIRSTTQFLDGQPHGPFVDDWRTSEQEPEEGVIRGYHFLGRRLGKGFQLKASFCPPHLSLFKLAFNLILTVLILLGVWYRPSFVTGLLFLWPIIFVHELGHFLAARFYGIPITHFRVGVGPSLVAFLYRGVRYEFAAIPILGYVMPMVCRQDELDRFQQLNRQVRLGTPIDESLFWPKTASEECEQVSSSHEEVDEGLTEELSGEIVHALPSKSDGPAIVNDDSNTDDKPPRQPASDFFSRFRRIVYFAGGVIVNLAIAGLLLLLFRDTFQSARISMIDDAGRARRVKVSPVDFSDIELIKKVRHNNEIDDREEFQFLTDDQTARFTELLDLEQSSQVSGAISAIGSDVLSGPAAAMRVFILLNIVIAVLNLLPIPPLDGFKITEAFFKKPGQATGKGWYQQIVLLISLLLALFFLFDFARVFITDLFR